MNSFYEYPNTNDYFRSKDMIYNVTALNGCKSFFYQLGTREVFVVRP